MGAVPALSLSGILAAPNIGVLPLLIGFICGPGCSSSGSLPGFPGDCDPAGKLTDKLS